jgi:hypothetical protein
VAWWFCSWSKGVWCLGGRVVGSGGRFATCVEIGLSRRVELQIDSKRVVNMLHGKKWVCLVVWSIFQKIKILMQSEWDVYILSHLSQSKYLRRWFSTCRL